MQYEIIEIDPRAIQLLKLNARYMRHETYTRLVANVKKDGALSSVPLLAPLGLYASGDEPQRDESGQIMYEVLSGNHRTKAAIDAGLATIHAMALTEPVDRERRIALQLSHNSLTGEDDPALLKMLYEQLDIDWKQFAALDDKQLQLLAEVKPGSLGEASLSYQSLTFVFLPHEIEMIEQAYKEARMLNPGALYLARFSDYDRFLDGLEDIGSAHMVRNAASQVLLMLDVFNAHLGEQRDGWYDAATKEAKHDKTAPLSSLFNATTIPTRNAVHVARALAAAKERQIKPADALEMWAQAYLASLK
jgi:hypothetical protein